MTALDKGNRVDDGIAAVTRGLGAIPPPRRIPLLWARAKLLEKKNDAASERATLDAAVALFPVTPSSPHFDSVRREIEKRREVLRAAGR